MTMKQPQTQSPTATTDDTSMLDEILADVVAAGKDTTALSRDDRAALLVGLARKLGLNALSGAVMFLRTQGRETLYVTKQGTDQIAARERLKRETIRGPEVVAIEGRKVVFCQVRATHPDGRSEVSTATLALSDVVNDLMKCETKAKRRATLSVCGLGLLAEDEIETIPGAEPVVVAPPITARLDATTLNALGVEQRATVRERVADVMASVGGENPTLGEFNRAVNEDAEPTAFELAARALVNAPSLQALRDEWVRVTRDVWPTLGPAERDALAREKETRKATLGQPTPPDGDPPKGRRTRRPTAPVDATSAPQEGATTPDAGPAAWAPVTLSSGDVVRSAEDARAILRTYPEPRLRSSAKAHGGEWAALCDAELLARAAMARRAA